MFDSLFVTGLALGAIVGGAVGVLAVSLVLVNKDDNEEDN